MDGDILIADKGYDSQAIIDLAVEKGIEPVIPPRRTRTDQRAYDQYLYKMRHLVENAFMRMKEWRGIATRYAKKTSSYLASVQIRCIFLWASIA